MVGSTYNESRIWTVRTGLRRDPIGIPVRATNTAQCGVGKLVGFRRAQIASFSRERLQACLA
jgi:hypothetical protein